MPQEKRPEKNHVLLFRLPTVQNAKKNITKVGQYRNLRFTLTGELLATYMDEDGNFVFQEFYLEEKPDTPKTGTAANGFASAALSFEPTNDRDDIMM